MWLLIDNYDSFTHILHHYLLQIHDDIIVIRNDELDLEGIIKMNPERIIISPGPKTPMDAGVTNAVIHHFVAHIPILGICLGHQALGIYFGAAIKKALKPVHGSATSISHQNAPLFAGIPNYFQAMRYHSLIISEWETTNIIPLAFSEEGELMAFSHAVFPATGIQFHPESILTEHGLKLLKNWHISCS